jgi:hypothetical protein
MKDQHQSMINVVEATLEEIIKPLEEQGLMNGAELQQIRGLIEPMFSSREYNDSRRNHKLNWTLRGRPPHTFAQSRQNTAYQT